MTSCTPIFNQELEQGKLGPVHTNPFSNENGAVLLHFQKDLRPHYNAVSFRFENAFIPSVRMLNEIEAT